MKTLTDKIAMIIANRLEVGGWNQCDENKRNLYRHIAQAALEEIKFEQLLNTASGGLKDTDKAQADANAKMSLISGDPFYAVLFAYWEDMQALLSELEKTE